MAPSAFIGSAVYSLKHLLRSTELLRYLTIANLKLAHKNLLFGYFWWVLNPLLWMFVYWLLVVGIFNRGEPNYPLFVLCAILPWRAFATSIGQSMTSISRQEGLIKQVAFPKAVLPLSVVLSNAVYLVFGLLVLALVAIVYGILPTGYLLFLPVITLIQLTFTAGLAFIFSIVAVYFADIRNLMQFILRIWLYLSPSLYSIERVPQRFRDLFMLNPWAPIFTSYRNVIMYRELPEWGSLAVAALIAFGTLALGFAIFICQERNLSKVI